MNCPSCNKFASLDTQDPEVNDIEASYHDGVITVTGSARTVRNSACCGDEMKAIDWDVEETVKLEDIEGIKELPEEEREKLRTALDDEDASVEVEENGTDFDESGGGRYKKNIITSRVHAEVTIQWGERKFTHGIAVETANAASEFEEQC